MRLQFLGSGDAFGSGGRFNTCFHVTWSGGNFLVDCGASSMVAIRRFGVDPNAIRTVLVSHLHGDHFGGLPFFLLDAQLVSRRTAPLTIAGPPGLERRLLEAMENFFPGSTRVARKFALEIVELADETRAVVNGLAVTPYTVTHYSGAPPYALRIEVDGKVLTYSGDTEWAETLIAAARGADLFICEAYFYAKPVKYHLDWKTLEARLAEIGPKRLILTHMSPDMLAHPAEAAFEKAEDGLVVEI
jgi:ribonuclease BN (tRNA processing enzyme)